MNKVIFMLAVGLLLLFMLAACSCDTNGTDTANETTIMTDVNDVEETDGTDEENTAVDASDYPSLSWQTITATEALNMMAKSHSFVLLDVRTVAEYQEIRIEGALLIPYDAIKSRAETELSDKNAVILIYCRSGRRSAIAAADLVALGFTSVYDFGGIINWPYESISG